MRALALVMVLAATAQAGKFVGHNADKSTLRTTPLDKPSGHVVVKADNLDEDLDVNIYKADGTFDDAVLAKLDDMWRDTGNGDVRAVDSRLYEQLSRIYDHFGKKIHMVSGHRKEEAASRHNHASAMDIRVEGTSYRTVYQYAQTLDIGGDHAMGIGQYPNSEFVHVDFRAPNDASFRWTDYSGGSAPKKKSTGRTTPAKKPTS